MSPPFPAELERHSIADTWALIENDAADISELPEIIRQWESSLRLNETQTHKDRLQANKSLSQPTPPPPPPLPPTEPTAEPVVESHATFLVPTSSIPSPASPVSETADPLPTQDDDTMHGDDADTIVVGQSAIPLEGQVNWVPVVPANITIVWQWKQSVGDVEASNPPPNAEGEYELEWVGAVGYRVYNGTARARVCVKWQGWSLDDTTWAPLWKVTDWSDAPENIAALKKRVKDQAVADGLGFEDLPADQDSGDDSDGEPEAPEPPSTKRKASARKGRGRGKGRPRKKAR